MQLDAEPRQQSAIVLPELTQCFVRCIEGLEGVLYLRKEILKDCDRFWIVGCNHWAWEYLSYVCQINAYFDRTVALPELTGYDLFAWLAPVRRQLGELLPGGTVPSPGAQREYLEGLGGGGQRVECSGSSDLVEVVAADRASRLYASTGQ